MVPGRSGRIRAALKPYPDMDGTGRDWIGYDGPNPSAWYVSGHGIPRSAEKADSAMRAAN